MTLIANKQPFLTDKEGYLVNLTDWNEAVAQALAAHEHLVLTNEHWTVIYFLRDFYQHYQTTPFVRVLVKELAKKMGTEKGNSVYLNALFPEGLLRQASKIAGLPKPTRCT